MHIAGGKLLKDSAVLAFPGISVNTTVAKMRRNGRLLELYDSACRQREEIRRKKRAQYLANYRRNNEHVRKKSYERQFEWIVKMRKNSAFLKYEAIMKNARLARKETGETIREIKERWGIPHSWRWLSVDYRQHEIEDPSNGVFYSWNGYSLVKSFVVEAA